MYHICHISTTFNKRSGSARRTLAILKACLARGYRISLITGRDHDVNPGDISGLDIYVVPQLVKYISCRSDLAAPFHILKILKNIQPDIVHTHLAKAGILGRWAAQRANVPVIMHTVHGPTFPLYLPLLKRHVYRLLEVCSGRYTDHFVFVGKELQTEYVSAGVCQQERSSVIYTGKPDSLFSRNGLSVSKKRSIRKQLCGGIEPDKLVITVGRIVPSKQLDHALRTMRLLHDRGYSAHLAIVGKCLLEEELCYEETLAKLATELGLREYVHFSGFRNDIIDVMEASEVMLLTSSYEGLPNVAVEAAISGTPLIAYEVSGLREVLGEEENCWIVPQSNIQGITNKLEEVLFFVDKKKSSMSVAGLDKFRESVMVSAKLDLYSRLLRELYERKDL